MVTTEDWVNLAELEYRRDPRFADAVDTVVTRLMKDGHVPVGSPLRTIFSSLTTEGELVARVLLDAHHNRTTQPQWQRARELESDAKV